RPFFIQNLLRYLAEKILLLNTTIFRGDYPRASPCLEQGSDRWTEATAQAQTRLGDQSSAGAGREPSRLGAL
ncbi:hypothetical protein, partial [Falsiphaeobacter marinintestinus]|uniref:hypothetical protein n=1 Tax=Falsiphaeobacter marinintestinus TaxID=1492905 RepID=UPI001FEBD5F8